MLGLEVGQLAEQRQRFGMFGTERQPGFLQRLLEDRQRRLAAGPPVEQLAEMNSAEILVAAVSGPPCTARMSSARRTLRSASSSRNSISSMSAMLVRLSASWALPAPNSAKRKARPSSSIASAPAKVAPVFGHRREQVEGGRAGRRAGPGGLPPKLAGAAENTFGIVEAAQVEENLADRLEKRRPHLGLVRQVAVDARLGRQQNVAHRNVGALRLRRIRAFEQVEQEAEHALGLLRFLLGPVAFEQDVAVLGRQQRSTRRRGKAGWRPRGRPPASCGAASGRAGRRRSAAGPAPAGPRGSG